MKKFVLAFGIPVLAVASLIGSGYATWYFNNAVTPDKDGKIGLKLTEKAVGARFQHSEENIKLVLDQKDKTDDGMPHDRKGVHFEGTFSESLIADADGNPDTPDTFVSGTSYIVTTTITIPSAVATYVNFTFDGQTSSATPANLTLTKTQEFKYTDLVGEIKNTFKVFDITDVTAAYADEPSTLVAYNTMLDAVKDQTIDFSFTAVVAVK